MRENEGTIVLSSSKGKLTAIKGLKDYMVLDLDDVLLICPRDEVRLKEFLSELAMPQFEKYK